ncbi:F-box/kelch-repeat protein At3g06240-like [Alnus glutinosa]|uniref:F-box/kelch-repeat protein At3g06240-like n=1 Tax=Alnus glutinosa TaxID=3517 RepID=UPI002D785910|nr:F-box/kelch-repeat protein At3g06240-like [Alnus glutinosa]
MHRNRSIEINRERILILERYKGGRTRDYYLVNFSDEDRFGKPVEIFPPFHHPEIFTSIINCCDVLKIQDITFEPIIIALGFHGLHKQPTFAFGYDPVNNDYKAVRIVVFVGLTNEVGEVKVYSLKAHSWRRVEDRRPCKNSLLSFEMAFSNGALHWLVDVWVDERYRRRVIAFDLTTEKFQDHTPPIESDSNYIGTLEVLGGSLCVSTDARLIHDEPRQADIWMIKEYGVTSSWSWLYTIFALLYRKSVVFSKDGEEVLIQHGTVVNEPVWYGIKKKTRRNVELDKHIPTDSLSWIVTVVGSLVLLDGDSV